MVDLYDMPGHLIRRLNQISVAPFTARMAEAGIDLTSVQLAALSAIRENPGVDQATLAGMIAYDRVTIGGVVDRLAAKDLLTRRVSPRDRRTRTLELARRARRSWVRPCPCRGAGRHPRGAFGAGARQLQGLLRKATAAGNDRSRAPFVPLARPDAVDAAE